MSERATIGSMYGFHTGELPECTHECREADIRHDKAECAMCQALTTVCVWDGHKDLKDVPGTQAAVADLFMENMAADFESFVCPFPETDECRSLRVLSRPKNKP